MSLRRNEKKQWPSGWAKCPELTGGCSYFAFILSSAVQLDREGRRVCWDGALKFMFWKDNEKVSVSVQYFEYWATEIESNAWGSKTWWFRRFRFGNLVSSFFYGFHKAQYTFGSYHWTLAALIGKERTHSRNLAHFHAWVFFHLLSQAFTQERTQQGGKRSQLHLRSCTV